MHLSDDALRRLAGGAFAGCCLLLALGVVVSVAGVMVDRSPSASSPDNIVFGLLVFSFPVVGVLIARRQPRNAIGWVMLAIGYAAFFPTGPYADYGLVVQPGSLPGAAIAAALTGANWAPVLGLVGTFLILLFPDGHVPSPRWRWVAWFSGLSLAYVYVMLTLMPGSFKDFGYPGVDNPLGVPLLGDLVDVLLPTVVVLAISFLLCAGGLVQRFRRSSGVERLQLKWLATAAAVVAAFYFAGMMANVVTGFPERTPWWLQALQILSVLMFVLIPIAIGVAILKHGLYEIDVVINKAVVFAILASFITAVYVAIVVGMGRLIGSGDRPNLALSIAATAVVAVAFEPVRNRVQRFANRLVYGVRATPYEVLADFADRVGGAYDAAELLPRMARTVAEGLGAARVEVWLADGGSLTREAAWPAPSDGAPDVASTAGIDADRVAEVRHHGGLLGALAVVKPVGETLTPPEEKLLDDVAGQAGLVLRNVRLIEDLRSSRERLVTTQEDERRRLERNLHDGAQQSLVAVTLMLSTARARLSPELEPSLGPALDQAAEQLRLAIEELRELARGIHPAILTERGLVPAVRSLAERCPVPVDLDVRLEDRPAPQVELALYFVVAEALTNVAKYAHATQVTVTLSESRQPGSETGGELVLEVRDDGIGGADPSRGSGLAGLQDRAGVVDGTITVHSPPGRGTTVRCTVPARERQRSAAGTVPSSVPSSELAASP